ncbi:MAG: class I SAM-dependent methyltransferase [Nostoc sp. S4]|nr:class I SAM-dependent methyltransferase [Nostoc sp. S4]
MNTRIQREKDFHDRRFSNPETRDKTVNRFYEITKSINSAYQDFLFRNCKESKVIEYGCGTESHAFALADRGAQLVIAIDISPIAIEIAEARFQAKSVKANLAFKVMDAEDLEFDESSIDLILGSGILHHLDIEKSLNSMIRVLRPSGKAIFIEPMGHNLFINLFRKLTPNIRSKDEHPLLNNDLMLLGKYFKSVEVKYFYLTSILASLFVGYPCFQIILGYLEYLDGLLFKIPLLRYQAWQVLIVLSEPIKSCIDEKST